MEKQVTNLAKKPIEPPIPFEILSSPSSSAEKIKSNKKESFPIRKLGLLGIALIIAVEGIQFSQIIGNKSRIVKLLYGTPCLLSASITDNYLDRNQLGSALKTGVPASIDAYLREQKVDPAFFDAWCETANKSESQKSPLTEIASINSTNIVNMTEGSPEEEKPLVNIGTLAVEGEENEDMGMTIAVPPGSEKIGLLPPPISLNSVLNTLYLYQTIETDYYLIPGYALPEVGKFLNQLGLNKLPRREDGSLIEAVPELLLRE